jgi:Carotenoid biosynthesis protein
VTALPVWAHELLLAPGALSLAFLHARRALGTARAALELCVLAGYGFLFELLAIRLFASHDYGRAWTLAPLGVPVAVAAVWAAVISSAMALGPRLGWPSALGCGTAAALLGIVLDLAMEPVAVRVGLWSWTPPGPWLGIPIGNFVGWAVVVGVYTASAEIWPEDGSPLRRALARRVTVAAFSIALLLAVGAAWRSSQVERAFMGRRGWGVWGGLIVAAALLGLIGPARRADAAAHDRGRVRGLASRLAMPPAALPASTLLLVAAAFAADAALLGRADLGLVVLAALGVLVLLGCTASVSR